MGNAHEDLHISQLARGAVLTLANAQSLFEEAEVLFSCKAYSRCLFLHQISLEECGKIEILGAWAVSLLMEFPFNPKKVQSALASHKAKNFANAYMLPVSERERTAQQSSDMRTMIQIFNEQQTEFHNESNNKKNAALYVDLVESVFQAPVERIIEDICKIIATRNAEFLQLVSPKVAMLGRWAKDTEGAQATLIELQTRLEVLRAEHGSDSPWTLDGVLDEMLAKAKE